MNLTFEKFKEVVTRLVEADQFQTEYLNKIPDDIQSAIFDNEYANSKARTIDYLIETLFGEYAEDVMWFIWEANGNNVNKVKNISFEDREYAVYDLESYFAYAEKELKFKE